MLNAQTKKDASYCTFCPKMCHFACPVAEVEKNEAYTPWGKQQTARLVEAGQIPLDAQNAAAAYKCLTCRSSETFCAHDIVVADSLHQMREAAVERDVAPPEVYQFGRQFSLHQNPYGKDLQEKLKQLVAPEWFNSSSTVFFPSCHTLALSPHAMGDYTQLFQKLHVDNLSMMDEPLQCCGHALWVLGLKKEFQDLAHVQFNVLKRAESIVVGSPECAWTLKEVYPQLGFKFSGNVFTLPEFVGEYFKHVPYRVKHKTRVRYFYHDSCYMGRYLGQYDLPRRLLEMVTGFPPEEFSWNRSESVCSGGGGGYSLTSPDMAKEIPKRHLQEMQEKGVKLLITSCSKSAQQFKQLGENLVVKDLVAFLNESLQDFE